MTRARALKTLIRARAAKTGERYTTARRHVLGELVSRRAAPSALAPAAPLAPRAPAPPAPLAPSAPPAPAKGGLSDAKTREKTGHGLDHWFAVLDRFGGPEKGHTALARHLNADHGVPGWHSQGITVAYERARGVRNVNQRCDGEYEVSVSKTVNATTAAVVKALTDPRRRKRWSSEAETGLAKAFDAAGGSRSKGVVVRPDGLGRFRYKWSDSVVQMYLVPKPGGKVSIVVTNSKLTDGAMVEARRTLWRTALSRLAALF